MTKKASPKKKVQRKAKPAAAPISETVLCLRTCDAKMRAYGGFVWPKSGPVAAPDWKPTQECGNGLHGLLWGEGEAGHLNFDNEAKWLVVEVEKSSIVDLSGKVKFPRCVVAFCGDKLGATSYLSERLPKDRAYAVVGGTATAGDRGTATAGYRGTATAGDRGTATAGDGGTATAGDRGTATAGVGGTATAGDGGTATAGYRGTATAGYRGTATAGDRGTATAGDGGTATAGDGGTATAGDGGVLAIHYHDDAKSKWRVAIAEVGENNILAGKKYRLEKEKFVIAE